MRHERQEGSESAAGPRALLVHYGEIALKRGNRARFEDLLVRNMRTAIGRDVRCRIAKLPGRMVVDLDEDTEVGRIVPRLARVFGVANIAVAERVEPTIEAIRAAALAAATSRRFASFAVRARRGEKRFPMNSQEINEQVGETIRTATGSQVDLSTPELTVGIEVMDRCAFVFADRVGGPGGLPVSEENRVACLLSGGIDSPVAAWRMMKRGCLPLFVHFHSAPFTSAQSQDKAEELAERLVQCQPASLLAMIPFGEIQKKIVVGVPQEYRVVLYRRFMVRIACAVAARHGAHALVTGEALGQVASQTIENMAAIDAASTLPIFRPLVGMDKDEIVGEARRIGTYDLSVQPHDDCCSFLTPRHPATRSTADELARVERSLDVEALVALGLEGVAERRIASDGEIIPSSLRSQP